MSKFLCIIGMGSYYFSDVCINVDFEVMVDISDEWIIDCIGIKECCIVGLYEMVVIMGVEVSKKVFEVVGIDLKFIDMIVCVIMLGCYVLFSSVCEI